MFELGEPQHDALAEIFNIGVGRAARAMNEIVSEEVAQVALPEPSASTSPSWLPPARTVGRNTLPGIRRGPDGHRKLPGIFDIDNLMPAGTSRVRNAAGA